MGPHHRAKEGDLLAGCSRTSGSVVLCCEEGRNDKGTADSREVGEEGTAVRMHEFLFRRVSVSGRPRKGGFVVGTPGDAGPSDKALRVTGSVQIVPSRDEFRFAVPPAMSSIHR